MSLLTCRQCYETLAPGTHKCPGCGWLLSETAPLEVKPPSAPPEEDEAKKSRDSEKWIEQWRAQFERRRVLLPREMRAHAQRLMSQAERQMRLASIVFADLSGFSAETKVSRPENIESVLRAFCEISVETAAAHNGFVVNFAGDGVLMVFGAPVAYDADIENAVKGAVELVDLLAELQWPGGRAVRSRAGVATGEVLSTATGAEPSKKYTLIGNTVNLAARLEQNAKAGEVLVCRDRRRRVAHLFEMEPTPPLFLKNIQEDYVAWKIVREREIPASPRLTEIRFVGRKRELEELCGAIRNSRDDGPLHVVVSGEAGIGKTRLLEETSRRLEETYRFIFLSGAPHGVHILLFPLIEWLRRLLFSTPGVHGSDMSSLIEVFCKQYPAIDPADALLLGYLFGVPEALAAFRGSPPERIRENLFRVFADVARAVAGDRSLVLVLDDMQWADDATIEWGRWLIQSRPAGKAVLVELIRIEEEHAVRSRLLPERRPDFLLPMPPLCEEERRQLLASLLPSAELEPGVRLALESRGGGNPFFSSELARAVTELLASEKKPFLDESAVQDLIPDAVQSVVQWRLDRLSEKARLVLQCGAVLGLEFARGFLELIEFIREGLQEQLRLLKSRSFLEEIPKVSERLLRFYHPITRDVVYRLLLPEQRRSLHEHVASQMESAFPDAGAEHCEALAYHWSKAENPAKAVFWMIRTAERRHSMGAYGAALAACKEGLGLLRSKIPDGAAVRVQIMRLLIRSGRIKTTLGDLAGAKENLAEARAIAEEIGNLHGQCEARLWQGICLKNSGEAGKARPTLEEAEVQARALDVPHLLTASLSAQGVLAWQQARSGDALRCFREVTRLAEEHQNSVWLADALNNTALVLWKQGDFGGALKTFRDALPHRRRVRDLAGLAVTLMNIGIIEQGLEHYTEARDSYTNARELALKIAHRTCLAALASNLSDLSRAEKDFADAAKQAAEGIRFSQEAGDRRLESYAENNLARALIALERFEEAIPHARRARKLAAKGSVDEQGTLSAALSLIEARVRGPERRAGGPERRAGLSKTRSREGILRILDRILQRVEENDSLRELRPRALALAALAKHGSARS